MNSDDLAALVKEHLDESPIQLIERDDIIRELPKPARFNLVHIITGMRRCGKTFYLFQLMNHLLNDGVQRNLIFLF